jgi:cytochrome P450
MHVDENVWGDDAAIFRPSRWDQLILQGQDYVTHADSAKRTLHAYEYTPFLGGPRQCIGRQFALMELRLFITHLIRQYQWSVPEDSPAPTKSYTVTARPIGVILKCTLR